MGSGDRRVSLVAGMRDPKPGSTKDDLFRKGGRRDERHG
jgi:hypothetical protein